MIIQSLVRRYEDIGSVSPGWQRREVSYALDISGNGVLLGVVPLEFHDGKNMRKREFILPVEPPGRTSGIKSAFLCDNGGYLLGADPKRGAEKFQASRELHLRALEKTGTVEAAAIKAYFEMGAPADWIKLISFGTAAAAKFVFQVNGRFICYETDSIRAAWDFYYAQSDSDEHEKIRCLVTGKLDSPVPTHGALKLRGGQSSGSSLISANCESFTSYGKTVKDRAADIGKYAAFAYVTALNDLLKSENNRQFIGGDTLVYWSEDGGGLEEEVFSWTSQPKESDADRLSALMERAASGRKVQIEGCKPDSKFYLLCLSPNSGRISIRFFYADHFGAILAHNLRHYSNLELYKAGNDRFQFLPPWLLLSETTVKKSASDAAPLLGGQLMHSIISGDPYPLTLYHSILARIRAGEDITKTKAAIIKAFLIRNFNEGEVVTMMLNTQTDDRPYALGQLFSVLEQLQTRAAKGKLNSTIRGRFFTRACSNPGNVFPILLKLSNHHSSSASLDDKNRIFFEKLKTEILRKIPKELGFPSTLTLEEQGKFILGYYHQTQDFFTSKKDREE
ncbi:MAG: type I-C CRISPR-associated protein Cas8c/Csd1 [Peptococcaceae bacterium]|jgi:CRISPR-associated protein Csd1|nr:type I-C CRISPR-associated protein Cas8c/Csd1 [Peptococcaceae bacterium]